MENTDYLYVQRGNDGFKVSAAALKAYTQTGAYHPPTNLEFQAATNFAVVTSSTGDNATLTLFSGSRAGLVQASGGGTTRFLRADGVWTTPPSSDPGVTSIIAGNNITIDQSTGDVTISATGGGTGTSYTFNQPLVENAGVVSINLQLLSGTP